ncbi:hypothetical protein NMY3_03026 [Candidatus Nitrosocosmicus oleophilus]|uniref:Uncharacterized protein n=1 Tax=Candidatus Nitrosocosmicus oleophilus TaxID=1353260 RepID=A0A654M3F7_9ARCH|nr:hypothetical protein [Candidatus Nitrosocosmicus oleophilus]ALI37213.1 hypothetical protein NMY3_03026 [Candidatus Nitrosocosmicus oleophilus]
MQPFLYITDNVLKGKIECIFMINKQFNLLIIEGADAIDPNSNVFTLYDALDSKTFQNDTYSFDLLVEEISRKTFTDISVKTEKIRGTALASLLNFLVTLDCKLTNKPNYEYKDFEELLDTPTTKLLYPTTLNLKKD